MRKQFIIFILSITASAFSQGNFTTEWESPDGWEFSGTVKLDMNSNVYDLAFADASNEHSVRIYNGLSHSTDYGWTWSGTHQYFDFRGIRGVEHGSVFCTDHFDATGEINSKEIFQRNSQKDYPGNINIKTKFEASESYKFFNIICTAFC